MGFTGLAHIPVASPALAALVASLFAAACARSAGSSSCGGEDSREGPLLLEKAHLVMLPTQLPPTVGAPGQLDILGASLQRSFYVLYCIPPKASSAQPAANWLTMLKADHAMACCMHKRLCKVDRNLINSHYVQKVGRQGSAHLHSPA